MFAYVFALAARRPPVNRAVSVHAGTARLERNGANMLVGLFGGKAQLHRILLNLCTAAITSDGFQQQ